MRILLLIATVQAAYGLATPVQNSAVDFFNPVLGGGSMLDNGL